MSHRIGKLAFLCYPPPLRHLFLHRVARIPTRPSAPNVTVWTAFRLLRWGKAMKVPFFKASGIVKAPDAELIAVTKNGKGKMPAHNGKLTDAQIKEAIAYIRTLQKK